MKTTKRSDYQAVLMQLISCRPVAYWPRLARAVGGVKAAVMLSQLLYWNGDQDVQKRDGNWFFKTVEDMEAETGLTKVEQQTARACLMKLRIIDCKLKSMPRTWWYRVNMDELGEVLIGKESHPMGKSSNDEVSQHSAGKSPNIGKESHPMLDDFPSQLNKESETTSETTIIDYSETSSSSVNSDQEEEGYKIVFSESEISDLRAIGLFEEKLNEAARLVSEKDINEDELAAMIRAAKVKEPAPGKTAALLLYRLRNAPKRLSAEELEAMKCKSYTIPGVTA